MLDFLKKFLNKKRKYIYTFRIENYPGFPTWQGIDDIVGQDFASKLGVFIVEETKDERGHILIIDSKNFYMDEILKQIFSDHNVIATLLK